MKSRTVSLQPIELSMSPVIHTILQFPSITELVDFQMITDTARCTINDKRLTISGAFTEAQIELAQAGFQARVLQATLKK